MRLPLLACAAMLAFASACDEYGGETLFGVTPGGGVANRLFFTVQPSTVNAGTAIIPAVQVTVQNANGQTVTNAVNPVTVNLTVGTGTSGAQLNGTKTVNAINGIATFNNLVVDRSGVGFTLTATGAGLATAVSNQFSVNPVNP